ncbi:Ribosomal RNA small subunit methyltransferase I [Sphingomonas antarctica]|uniref:16S rRNA (cytidine(1402)-2'-O)-methyltransferase n=1 Tax=Sphingomonas antarctica TaxID=2040274 RepID=UPI0039E78F63
MSEKLSPGLYIVATPIGNLGDITRRAVETLCAVDAVACEDTRVTGKLLHLLGIKRPLIRHDDHSDARAVATLVERCRIEAIALTSDAGTPLISDPGYELVRAARAADVAITTLPGANAAIAALTLSGLPTDRFLFAGFLPVKAGARAQALAELAPLRATLVFFESGPRLAVSLAAMAEVLGDRQAAVVREISKLHEDVRAGTLTELAAGTTEAPRGEIVVVIAPPAPVEIEQDDAALDALLTNALTRLPVAKAASEVAKATGADRRTLYARALALK